MLTDRPPAGPGWLHEVKHDGFRVLARKQGERVQIWSRRGTDLTYRFPTIAEAIRSLSADRALIDGEAVVLRVDGRSDFGALMTKRGGAQASFVAFDLLRLNGDDLRLRPIEVRREALMRLVAGAEGILFEGILFSEALVAEGAVVFAKACELGLVYTAELCCLETCGVEPQGGSQHLGRDRHAQDLIPRGLETSGVSTANLETSRHIEDAARRPLAAASGGDSDCALERLRARLRAV